MGEGSLSCQARQQARLGNLRFLPASAGLA
jgi:hypothetical protein